MHIPDGYLKRYWRVLLAMAVLSPLGLLAEGTAWGEWAAEDLQAMLGYVPFGLARAGEGWQAMFPDYSVRFLGEGRIAAMGGYMISAIVGSALVYGLTLATVSSMGRLKKSRPGGCD